MIRQYQAPAPQEFSFVAKIQVLNLSANQSLKVYLKQLAQSRREIHVVHIVSTGHEKEWMWWQGVKSESKTNNNNIMSSLIMPPKH